MRIRLVVLALLALAVTAAPAPAAAAGSDSVLKCVVIVEEGGDMGERVCFDEPDCLVAYYRTTFIGGDRYCLVPRPVGATTRDASTGAERCVLSTYSLQKPHGSKYCVDTEPGASCIVSEYRSAVVGGGYYCHVRRPQP